MILPTHARRLMLAAMLSVQPAWADPVPITNHSFEANFAANGTFPVFVPTGWTVVDPGSIINFSTNAVGCLNPTDSQCFVPAQAPDGRNAALIFLQSAGTTPVALTQVLTTVLQPSTRYRLTVEIGNIDSCAGLPPFDVFGFFELEGFPGYSVELRAGGQVIAADLNTLGPLIPDGAFMTSTFEFTTGLGHPRLGQPLEVRLTNLNQIDTPQNPGIEVDFDNVRLDATPICLADFNTSGGLSVQDLFDFLGAYFAGDPRADISGAGGISVQDIFDFLGLYFSGC